MTHDDDEEVGEWVYLTPEARAAAQAELNARLVRLLLGKPSETGQITP